MPDRLAQVGTRFPIDVAIFSWKLRAHIFDGTACEARGRTSAVACLATALARRTVDRLFVVDVMGDGDQKRPWRDVAMELAAETDPARFAKLAKELLKALERSNSELPHPRPGIQNAPGRG